MAYSTTPTTKATVSINSNGLTSESINVSQTFELTALDNVTALKNSTGIRRIEGANSGITIYDSSSYGDPEHQVWVFVHNPNTSTNGSVYIEIGLQNHQSSVENCTIGRLWEGKSCLFPILGGNNGSANNDLSDVIVTTTNATDVVEYCVFAERMDIDSTSLQVIQPGV